MTKPTLSDNAARVLSFAEKIINESQLPRPMFWAGKVADEEGAQELVAAGLLKPAISSTGSPMWGYYVKGDGR